MFNLKEMTNAAVTLNFRGLELKVTALTIDEIGELEAWVAQRLPKPIPLARELALGQAPETAEAILLRAQDDVRRGYGTIRSPEFLSTLGSLDGMRQLLAKGLRKHHSEIADDPDQLAVLVRIGYVDGMEGIMPAIIFGEEPKPSKTLVDKLAAVDALRQVGWEDERIRGAIDIADHEFPAPAEPTAQAAQQSAQQSASEPSVPKASATVSFGPPAT